MATVAASLACAGVCALLWQVSVVRAIGFSVGIMAVISAGGVALYGGIRYGDRWCVLAAALAVLVLAAWAFLFYYHYFILLEPPT
jgi:hypothetical protein